MQEQHRVPGATTEAYKSDLVGKRQEPALTEKESSASQPTASNQIDYEQEIRFAVVMYGGVSLAIYIHGVAQELLRLVRATSGADLTANGKPDKVAQIYQELSEWVRPTDPQDKRKRSKTRFVIDILSGTSAGGINAVFLAKALALRSKDLEKLRQTWLDAADMEQLLNTGGLLEPKRSLLKGDWMYGQLLRAFSDMNDAATDEDSCYTPEQIDLFVTTTDLNGVAVPIRLADMPVLERVHKGSFHFRFESLKLDSCQHLDEELNQLARKDFERKFDPMLAFVARCTSSFPIAFAPMKLANIKGAIGKDKYDELRGEYRSFFRWVPPTPLVKLRTVDFDERELADGGYLDNKPFGHAIDAMSFRAAKLRHCRKLFYVDPFPELAKDEDERDHFDFLENARDAAMTLPRYQTIRQDIQRVETSNSTQIRLQALRDVVDENASSIKGFTQRNLNQAIDRPGFENLTLRELTVDFGVAYASYHKVRLLNSTDDLALIVSGLHEAVNSQDLFLAVRYIVQAWRWDKYRPNKEEGKESELQFFSEFDYSFRLRRAVHLLEWARKRGSSSQCESLVRQLTRLQRTRGRLSMAGIQNPIWNEIRALGHVLTWDDVRSVLDCPSDAGRQQQAEDLYKRSRAQMDSLANAVKDAWARVFDCNRDELAAIRKSDRGLDDQYRNFDFNDMVSETFLEGSDVSEHTQTEIYRISPADGIARALDKKLAGYALADFGAFLKREWRENDIFWGRLDGAERIVSAILNHEDDQQMRDGFVNRLREAIVEQEAAQCEILRPALEALRDGTLQDYLAKRYKLPEPPDRDQSAGQIARASRILGRMFEEDVGANNRATSFLRKVGSLGAGVVALLAPQNLLHVFFTYWVQLLLLMSALFALFGELAVNRSVRNFGLATFVLTILVWALAQALTSFLARKVPVFLVRTIQIVLALVIISLLAVGYRHFREDLGLLWKACMR